MPEPIARWNPARSVWETTQGQLCGHSDVFSETWPSSGMTRGGTAYELPTWEQRTAGSGSLSSPLLPTPAARDWKDSGDFTPKPEKHKLAHEIVLLATPVASEGHKPSNVMGVARRQATGEVFLTNQIVSLCGMDPSERTTS